MFDLTTNDQEKTEAILAPHGFSLKAKPRPTGPQNALGIWELIGSQQATNLIELAKILLGAYAITKVRIFITTTEHHVRTITEESSVESVRESLEKTRRIDIIWLDK